tara:strand:- start:431 stop:1228 length:798 start_codon:yes stop_codon:yes gene_type:complete
LKYQFRRKFSQNFLIDTNVTNKILNFVSPTETNRFIEIGPGHGALTIALNNSGAELVLIEIDKRLISELQSRFVDPNPSRNILVNDDFLKIDISKFGESSRIIGNLPYKISTPILFKLLNNVEYISDIHIMLQKEVVDRIIANPDTSCYGRISVMIQAQASVEKLIEIEPESFQPIPKVKSAFIRIIPNSIKRKKINCLDIFSQLVKQSFSARRKTIRNNLIRFLPEKVLNKLETDLSLRAQAIEVDEFINIANFIHKWKNTKLR